MNKMLRFAVVALAIAVSVVAVTPNTQAMSTIGDCPIVEVSYDGGETWTECDNWGRFETRDSVTCYYDC